MVYDIIEELRSNNSRLFKESVLEKHKDDELLKKVLYYTLSPRKQYYIKKIPKYTPTGIITEQSSVYALMFNLLNILHDRKITGNDSINKLTQLISSFSTDDAKVLELIIQRDLKCGVNESTVNKIFPGLIEETPYMRVSLLKDLKKDSINWQHGMFSQEKLDGMFANIIVSHPHPQVLSRNGSSFPIEPFNDIINSLVNFSYNVFHGELVVYQGENLLRREIGNGILNSLLKTGEFDNSKYRVCFVVWDMIPESDWLSSECSVGYNSRYSMLRNIINKNINHISMVPTKVVYSFEEAKAHYKELVLQGKEGTILKDPGSIWKDYTSKQMWKFKVDAEAELRVVGFTEGNGKNKDLFGSINCISEDGLLEVNVSGFTDDERKEIHENRESYINSIMSVTYNAIMKSEGKKASMFLPRFKEWRLDKSRANTLQEIEDIFESVLEK